MESQEGGQPTVLNQTSMTMIFICCLVFHSRRAIMYLFVPLLQYSCVFFIVVCCGFDAVTIIVHVNFWI